MCDGSAPLSVQLCLFSFSDVITCLTAWDDSGPFLTHADKKQDASSQTVQPIFFSYHDICETHHTPSLLHDGA